MRTLIVALAAVSVLAASAGGQSSTTQPGAATKPVTTSTSPAMANKNPIVIMETSLGAVKIELWADKAPDTVKNFLTYVDEKFFDDTIFHRVIPGFMIQGGGFTKDMEQKKTHAAIKNEASGEVRNARGTLAMARTGNPHSATAQFFVNVADTRFLDKDKAQDGWGYAVFGKVIEGMDVVDKIVAVKTKTSGMFENVPVDPVVIKSITLAK